MMNRIFIFLMCSLLLTGCSTTYSTRNERFINEIETCREAGLGAKAEVYRYNDEILRYVCVIEDITNKDE